MFLGVLGTTLTRSATLRDKLRDIAAHEAALALEREVAVGPIRASGLRAICIDGIAVARRTRLAQGAVLSVGALRIDYSAFGALRSPADPLSALSRLTADAVTVDLVRSAGGALGLSGASTDRPTGASTEGPRLSGPGPAVTIRGLKLRYTDLALRGEQGDPLRVAFSGDISIGGVGRLLNSLQGRGPQPRDVKINGALHASAGNAPPVLDTRFSADCGAATFTGLTVCAHTCDEHDIELTRARVEYKLHGLLDGPPDASRIIQSIDVQGPLVRLVRDSDGKFRLVRNIEPWLPEPDPKRKVQPPRYKVDLYLESVIFEDRSLVSDGGFLSLQASSVAAQVDLARVVDAARGKRARPAGTVTADVIAALGSTQAAFSLDSDITTRMRVTGLTTLADGQAVIGARTIQARYNLGHVLGKQGAAGVSLVDVEGLELDLTLDEHHWPTFMPRGAAQGEADAGSAAPALPARIRVAASRASVTDRAVAAAGRPLNVQLDGLEADVDLAALSEGSKASCGRIATGLNVSMGNARATAQLAGPVGPGLEIEGLHVSDGARETLWADRVRLDLDCRSLMDDPAAALRAVVIDRMRANLVRDNDGRLSVLKSVPSAGAPTGRRTAGDFGPRVCIRQGDISYTDRSGGAGLKRVTVSRLAADVDIGHAVRASTGRRAGRIGSLRARVAATGPGITLSTGLRADLSRWVRVDRLRVANAAGGEIASLASGRLEFVPSKAFGGDVTGITRLVATDGNAELVREGDGTLRLARLLGLKTAAERSGPKRAAIDLGGLTATISLRHVRARLTDHSAPEGPAVYWTDGLSGTAALGRPGRGDIAGNLHLRAPAVSASATIRTDLARAATVSGLRVNESGPDGVRNVLKLGRADLEWRLAQALAGDPAGALRRVALQDLEGEFRREHDGRLRLARLAEGLVKPTRRADTTPSGPLQMAAVLDVAQANLRMTDASLAGGELVLSGEELNGHADLGRLLRATRGEPVAGVGWLRGSLKLDGPRLAGAVAIDADLDERLTVAGFALREVGDEGPRTIADIPRATVRFSLPGLFGERPIEAVQHLGLQGPAVELVRSRGGEWRLAQLIRELVPSTEETAGPPADLGRLMAGASITGGHVRFVDYSVDHGPLRAEVRNLRGQTPAGYAGSLMAGRQPRDRARIAAEFTAQWPGAVAEGALSTDLRRGIELTRFALSGSSGTGPRISGRRLSATVDFAGLAHAADDPVRILEQIEADGVLAQMTRDAQGTVDLVALLEPLGVDQDQAHSANGDDPLGSLLARMKINDARVRYTDRAINTKGPVAAELYTRFADLDLGGVIKASRGEAIADVGSFAGDIHARLPGGVVQARVESVDLSRLARLSDVSVRLVDAPDPAVTVRSIDCAYEFGALLGTGAQALSGIRRVELSAPAIKATISAKGSVDLARLIDGFAAQAQAESGPPVSVEAFGGLVSISEGRVALTDARGGGGPIRFAATELSARLDAGALWAARRREPAGPVGFLNAELQADGRGDVFNASVDCDVDRELRLANVALAGEGQPSPLLALDRAVASYDLVGLIAEDAPPLTGVRDVSVGRLALRTCRLADGTIELPDIVAAYLPQDGPSPASESGVADGAFLGGLRAHVSAENLALLHDDHAAAREPLRVVLAEGSADVDLGRVADLRAGRRGPSPGVLRGRITAMCADARAQLAVFADLGGRASLRDLKLTSDNGARTLLSSRRAAIGFDPVAAWQDKPLPRALGSFSTEDTLADIVVDEGGKWELARLLNPPSPPVGEPPELSLDEFVAWVSLSDTHVIYTDKRDGDNQPLLRHLEASDLTGRVDMARVWQARETGQPVDAGQFSGSFNAVLGNARAQGRIASDLATQAYLRDVVLTTVEDGFRRELLALGEAHIRGRLDNVIAGKPPAEQLHRAELRGLRANVVRHEDGGLQLQRALGIAASSAPRPPARVPVLAGQVVLYGADINYEDRALQVEGPVRVGLRDLAGQIDLAAISALIDGRQVAQTSRLEGHLGGVFGAYHLSGAVSTDVAHSARISGLTLRRSATGPAAVQADRLQAGFDLARIARGQAPAACLEDVTADGLRAKILRTADGQLEVAQGMKLTAASEDAAPGEPFTGSVRLSDTSIEFIDHSVQGDVPLQLAVRNASGRVDVGALEKMRRDGVGRDAGTVQADVSVKMAGMQGRARIQTHLGGEFTVTGLRIVSVGEQTGEVLDLPRGVARYDLGPILGGQGLMRNATYVGLHDLTARLTREADGRLRLARLAQDGLWHVADAKAPQPQEPDTFHGRLALENARIQYVDHALIEPGPLFTTLADTNLVLDMADPSKPSGVVNAQVHARTASQQARARIGGQFDRELVLADLEINGPSGQELVRARRVAVEGQLGALTGGHPEPLKLVNKLLLEGLHGTIRRNARGRIVSPELLAFRTAPDAERAAGAPTLAGEFRALVVARDVGLELIDDGALGEEGPLSVRLASLEGEVLAEGKLGGPDAFVRPTGALRGELRATAPGASVQTGFATDLVSNLWVTDLSGRTPSGEQLARLKQAHVRYDMAALLGGEQPYRAVHTLNLADAAVMLGTSGGGRLTVAGIPVKGLVVRSPGNASAAGMVGIEGKLAADERGIVRGKLTAGGRDSPLGDAIAQITIDPADGWLDARYSATRVELPLVGKLLLRDEDGTVLAGHASASGFAYGRIGGAEKDMAWSVTGRIEDAGVRLARLGDEPVRLAAPFAVTSEGLRTPRAQVRWGSVKGTLSGSVFSLQDPVLALQVTAEAADGRNLAALFPPQWREALTGVSLTDKAVLAATLTGPIDNGTAQVSLQTAGECVTSVRNLGDISLSSLGLGASIAGWREPSVRVAGDLEGPAILAPGGSRTAILAQAGAPETTVASLRVLSAASDLGQAHVALPFARLRGLQVEDLQASVRLGDERVELTGLSGEVMGGALAGAGSIILDEATGPSFEGRVRLAGLPMAELCRADVWPQDLTIEGTLDALLSGTVGGPATDYGVDLRAQAPVVNGKRLDEARLIVTGKQRTARLELAQLADGEGRLWLRGRVEGPPGGAGPIRLADLRTDLNIAASELDLSKAPTPVAGEALSGMAHLSGRLRGPLLDPDLDLWVQVFDVAVGDSRADALTAGVKRSGGAASVDYVMASAGQAVASLSGVRLEGFRLWPSGRGEGRPAPDGKIRGGLVQAFGPAGDLAAASGANRDAEGWFHVNGAVDGTLRRPTLNCLLNADHVRVGEFLIDEARLPLSLKEDTLLVSEGYVRAHGSQLSVIGRVKDLYGRRDYELVGTVGSLAIEDLPPVHRLGLDVAGIASVPQVTLWGSSRTSPLGGATFRLENLRVGRQELQPITGWVNFGEGLVRVSAARIRKTLKYLKRAPQRAQQVNVSVSATYAVRDKFLDAGVQVVGPTQIDMTQEVPAETIASLPDVGSLLQLVAPVVAIAESAGAKGNSPFCAPGSSPLRSSASSVVMAPRAQGTGESPPASHLLAQLGLRSSGQVAGQFRVLGPTDDLNTQARLAVWNAEIDGKALPRQVRASFSANLRTKEVYGIDAEAVDGRQWCMVTGSMALPSAGDDDQENPRSLHPIDLTVEGADIELPMWRQWMPRSASVGGSASFLFQATGSSEAPDIVGSVDILKPSYAGAQFDLLRLPRIEIRQNAIKVANARLTRTEQVRQAGTDGSQSVERAVAMQGSLPWTWQEPWIPADGAVDLQAQLEGIELGFFPTLMDEIGRERSSPDRRRGASVWSTLEAKGAVSGSLAVGGTWSLPELRGRLQLADGSIRAPGWQRPIEDIQVDVGVTRQNGRNRGQVDVAKLRWGGVTVSVDEAWAYLDHLGLGDMADNEYHLDASVSSTRRTAVSRLIVDSISGGASFHTREKQAGPGSGWGRLHVLALQDIKAQLGDGSVSLGGTGSVKEFSLAGLSQGRYDMELKCDRADVRYGKLLRGLVNGAIRVHGPQTETASSPGAGPFARIEGALTVEHAEVGLAAPKSGGEATLRGLSRRYPSPVFDVRVNTGDGVRLKGMGMTVPISRSQVASLTGTLHDPVLSGVVSAREGAVRVPGGAMQITGASVAYRFGPVPTMADQDRAPLELTGEVHAAAQQLISEAQVPGWGSGPVEVVINIDGELPDRIEVETSSVPPLSDEQVFALLGSQPLGGLQVSGGSFQDVLSEQALSLLAAGFKATVFEPIESELMRLLGLSELNIRFGFNQNVEIQLGKYLIKDLLVSYQTSVGAGDEDQYSLSLSYRLKNRVRVAYTTNERGDNRLKLSYDVDM